jgi:hypothetical protein
MFRARFDGNADFSPFTFEDAGGPASMEYTGTLMDLGWSGEHTLLLKCNLGTEVSRFAHDARGDNGLFGTVYSEPIKLMLSNPCESATVNASGAWSIPDTFAVPEGVDNYTEEFDGPSDTISITFMEGFGLCGDY